VVVPAVREPDRSTASLDVVIRLARDGMFWHHHALFDVIELAAEIDGQTIPASVLPNRWHEQAGGWSWIRFRLPLEARALPARLQLQLNACLPESVDARFEAWLCLERRT
jgi:hypothetical protein